MPRTALVDAIWADDPPATAAPAAGRPGVVPAQLPPDVAGDPAAARTAWQQALDILTDLDHPDADTVRAKLHGLGQVPTGSGS